MEKEIQKFIPINKENIKFIDPSLLLGEFKDLESCILCVICLNVVSNPVSCSICRKLICNICYEEYKRYNDKCPLRCTNNKLIIQKIDPNLKSILSIIKIRCPMINCNEKLKLEDLNNHLLICKLNEFKCIACGLIGYQDVLKAHVNNCLEFEEKCNLCLKPFKKKELDNHIKNCLCRSVLCTNCGEKYIFKNKHTFEDCLKIIKNKLEKSEDLKNDMNIILNWIINKKILIDNQQVKSIFERYIDVKPNIIKNENSHSNKQFILNPVNNKNVLFIDLKFSDKVIEIFRLKSKRILINIASHKHLKKLLGYQGKLKEKIDLYFEKIENVKKSLFLFMQNKRYIVKYSDNNVSNLIGKVSEGLETLDDIKFYNLSEEEIFIEEINWVLL